jgi:hypothetical protein
MSRFHLLMDKQVRRGIGNYTATQCSGCSCVYFRSGWRHFKLDGLKTFPLNSYRVHNILTEYTFDIAETERICGALPFTIDQVVSRTVRWFRELSAGEA